MSGWGLRVDHGGAPKQAAETKGIAYPAAYRQSRPLDPRCSRRRKHEENLEKKAKALPGTTKRVQEAIAKWEAENKARFVLNGACGAAAAAADGLSAAS